MANFTPEEISEILAEFFDVVGKRQYIGARYVPIFGRKDESSILWDNTKPYEPLTIVLYQGNSYTSRQYVPIGVDILDNDYWANTGNYNAQVEQYRQDVLNLREDYEQYKIDTDEDLAQWKADTLQDIDDEIAAFNDLLPATSFTSTNTVKKYVDTLDSATNNVVNYGADPSGNNDSYSAIQACIDANGGKSIYFPTGVYLISQPIITPYTQGGKVSIVGNGSILKPTASMPYAIGIGYKDYVNNEYSSGVSFVRDLMIDDPNGYCTVGISIKATHFQDLKLLNIFIHNCVNGILIGEIGDPGSGSTDCQFDNVYIRNTQGTYGTYGVKINSSDNKLNNMRIYGFEYSIINGGYGNWLTNIHNMAYPDQLATIGKDGAFLLENGGDSKLTSCYCDTYGTFIKLGNAPKRNLYIYQCNYLSYDDAIEHMYFIDASNITNSLYGEAINNTVTVRNNVAFVGVIVSSSSNLQEFITMEGFIFRDNKFMNSTGGYGKGDIFFNNDGTNKSWLGTAALDTTHCAYITTIASDKFGSKYMIDFTIPWNTPRRFRLWINPNVPGNSISANLIGLDGFTDAFCVYIYYITTYSYPVFDIYLGMNSGSSTVFTPIYYISPTNTKFCQMQTPYNQASVTIPSGYRLKAVLNGGAVTNTLTS